MRKRNKPWTHRENALIVADYLAMLADDIRGRDCNQDEHKRALQKKIDRSKAAIGYKYRNISAVLKGLGKDWVRECTPQFHFQNSLIDVVEEQLARKPDWLDSKRQPSGVPQKSGQLRIGPPPTLSNQPPPKDLEKAQRIAREFNVPEREEYNRALGKAGEERVLAHERAVLADAGCDDLAQEVRWVSQEDGDGAGYDIKSFDPDGNLRLIEVKTTDGWEWTPFYITPNEKAVSEERPGEWYLLRLWNFSREPEAFELRPPLERHVSLIPTGFRANLHRGRATRDLEC